MLICKMTLISGFQDTFFRAIKSFQGSPDPLRGTVEKEADLALDFPTPSIQQCSCFFSALYAVFPHKDSLNKGS